MKTIKRFLTWLDKKQPLSILLARLEVISGFALAVFAGLDYTYLLSVAGTGFDWTVFAVTGGIMVVKGIVTELARRYRATDL